ncbi:MAG: (4Fe-4S)-binding protein [Chloroflexota bacterium]|nr:MAG: (4Fe-4S)-binding protein [Chloroflexota bacterium]
MKQLVILSGKGGTGKTSVAAAFADLLSPENAPFKTVLADADVDASNLELVLKPSVVEREKFWGGSVAEIDSDNCSACGICAEVCRFDAVSVKDDVYTVDPIACDGCAACVYQCPNEAISMKEQLAGEWYRSESLYGPLFHAMLIPAQENSGKLVTLVKQQARLLALDEAYDLVLVDGPPGIGCPVISAVSGANLALIVAEPTASGVHDMHRVLETTRHFGVEALICINKADIYLDGTNKIEEYCRKENIRMVGKIPFDLMVTESMIHGKPVTSYQPNSPASLAIRDVWTGVMKALKDQEL